MDLLNNYNVKHRTLKVNIAVGDTKGTAQITNLPQGHFVQLGAVAKPDQPGIVDIAIFSNSTRIVDPMDVTFFDGKIGSFMDRTLRIDEQGGRTVDIEVYCSKAVATEALVVELVFAIYTRC